MPGANSLNRFQASSLGNYRNVCFLLGSMETQEGKELHSYSACVLENRYVTVTFNLGLHWYFPLESPGYTTCISL